VVAAADSQVDGAVRSLGESPRVAPGRTDGDESCTLGTKMPAQGHLNGDQNQNQFLSPLNELS
jgi:hypothetical protein